MKLAPTPHSRKRTSVTYQGKDETPESKLALANINQIIDRMIDAYARAVALAAADPKFAAAKAGWNDSLTTWYKYRNGDKTDGMDQLVAGILQKPLPPEPTPLTSLPTPAATPATTAAGAPGTNGAAAPTQPAATPASNPGTKPAATSTTPGTKPAATKPDRPRQ